MPMHEFQQLVNDAKKEIQEIDVPELKRMQQAGEKFILIDVREPNETAKGTVPGALTLPRGMLEGKIDQITTDKDAKIVLYCGGGSRSALAAQSLKKMGFKHPISVAGGWRAWSEQR
jgi:adenylyltransferase/sulfurtransferase